MPKMKHGKQAFTLIELLVVICIIAILAAMLLPALQSARDSATKATCVNNLAQMSKAYQMYATTYDNFMPARTTPYISGASGTCSWIEGLKDVMGQAGKSSFDTIFYCDADSSLDEVSSPASNGSSTNRPKKSYSLNNLAQAVHPTIQYTLDSNGRIDESTAPDKGFISGNRMTAVRTPSALIVVGENVAQNNTDTNVTFDTSDSTKSSGTACAPQQKASINRRQSVHNTAGNLFLDGHASHDYPEKTVPKYYTVVHGMNAKSTSMPSPGNLTTEGQGDWTDCANRKKGGSCTGNTCQN